MGILKWIELPAFPPSVRSEKGGRGLVNASPIQFRYVLLVIHLRCMPCIIYRLPYSPSPS